MKKIYLLLLFIILTVFTRPFFEAFTSLSNATEASDGDAVGIYSKAISWRSPFNTFAATASVRLLKLCDSTVEVSVKISCYESLHSALSRSRSAFFLLPFTWSGVPEQVAQERLEKIRGASLIQDQFPPTINFKAQLLTQVLFLSWVSLVLLCIWRGFGPSGNRTFTFKDKRFYLTASAICTCFVAWLSMLTI